MWCGVHANRFVHEHSALSFRYYRCVVFCSPSCTVSATESVPYFRFTASHYLARCTVISKAHKSVLRREAGGCNQYFPLAGLLLKHTILELLELLELRSCPTFWHPVCVLPSILFAKTHLVLYGHQLTLGLLGGYIGTVVYIAEIFTRRGLLLKLRKFYCKP